MRYGQPSQTARGAAAHRAVHQMLEGGAIFKDRFASRIFDEQTVASLNKIAADDIASALAFVHRRTQRLSEDTMADCVAGGVRQVVVLGAGLDTFSLRNPFDDLGVHVFEVDYAATQ